MTTVNIYNKKTLVTSQLKYLLGFCLYDSLLLHVNCLDKRCLYVRSCFFFFFFVSTSLMVKLTTVNLINIQPNI